MAKFLKKCATKSQAIADGHAECVKHIARSFYDAAYRSGMIDDPDIKEMIKLTDKFKLTKKGHWLITINPSNDIDIGDFSHAVLHIVCQKVWMCDWSLTFECGNENDHPHAHIVCVNNKAKSQVIREVYNSIKDFCLNKECIDVRIVDRAKAIKYITKNDDNSVKMRKKYKLDAIYTEKLDKSELKEVDLLNNNEFDVF